MAEENNGSSGRIVSGIGENDIHLELSLACYSPNPNPNPNPKPKPKPNPSAVQVQYPGEQEISQSKQELASATADNKPRTHNRQRSGSPKGSVVRQTVPHILESPRNGIIPAPYPWATDRRAVIHDRETLSNRNIQIIPGDVECRRCGRKYQMEFDLEQKLDEFSNYFRRKKESMYQRAPEVWMNPVLFTCKFCKQENSVKPIISDKKRSINWLFLFLGQAVGCCTGKQLKYFCKHTKKHRTGAKDRVLYLTYLTLYKQLYPRTFFKN